MAKFDPQEIQQKFERWSTLYQKQVDAQEQWQELENLHQDLKAYYFDEQWMKDKESDLPIQYSGKAHSIFSEDALWNMVSEQEELARKWIRLGIDALDNK